jgi:hypothetical protein
LSPSSQTSSTETIRLPPPGIAAASQLRTWSNASPGGGRKLGAISGLDDQAGHRHRGDGRVE